MWCKIVFFLLIICTSILCENHSVYYCIVEAESPGIIITDSKGKDSSFIHLKSIYLYNTTKFNFTENSDWTFAKSYTRADFNNEIVLDERWENFPDNHEEAASQLITRMDSLILSVKIYEPVLNLSEGKWHHLKSNISGIYTYYGDNKEKSSFAGNLKNSSRIKRNIWKLHEYNFLFKNTSQTVKDSLIYNVTEGCDGLPKEKSCISFYCAMCTNCSIRVEIQDSNNKSHNETFYAKGNRHWWREEICMQNFGGCFNISVTTNETSDGFWAISDMGYWTQYPNKTCKDNKRYISITKNFTDIRCETANNIEKNISTAFPEMNCPSIELYKMNYSNDNVTTHNDEKEEAALLSPVLYLAIIIPLCLIIMAILVGVYFCKKKITTKKSSKSLDYSAVPTKESNLELKSFANSLKWPGVFRKDFADYVKKCFDPNSNSKDLLRTQFNDLPAGFLKEAHEGLRQDNLKKNRYPNIIPYDENRVHLKRNLGEEYSGTDYINASYIKGFNGDTEYIITQNPKDGANKKSFDHTVTDFWRMIWQEQVDHIIMINSDNEEYVRYWPEINKSTNYGGIEIRLLQSKEYEFYVQRTLQIRRYGDIREVNQLHYHLWPADNRIVSSHTFVEFLNHMLKIPHRSSPVVLHCLAGVGRSGTMALCDIALRTEAVTGMISMFEITQQLRNCRVNMVQNVKQYQLAHLIVMEVLNYKDSTVETNADLEIYFSKLFETDIITQRWKQHLENTKWIHGAITPYIECKYFDNQNRYKDLLPVEQSRVILEYKDPDYINAMHVDGYRYPKKYIVAQQPLPLTLFNFWIMILQNKVKTIINLHEIDITNENYCCYFPTNDHRKLDLQMGLKIQFVSEEPYLNYDKLVADVYERDKHTASVTIVNVKNWFKMKLTPDSPNVVVDVWKEVQMKENSHTLICCDDGIRASGLVVCFFYMVDKMLQEKQCDIVGAVRAVRRSHLKFINIEQFEFLHHCVLAFHKTYCQD